MSRAPATATRRPSKAPPRLPVRVSSSARARVKGGAAEDGAAFRRDANDGPMAALSAARDPSPVERMRAVRLSRINHKRSGVYGQIVDTLVNFVYGDGVTVTCKSEAETAFWKRTAEDPENDWDGTLRRKLVGLLIDGEFILSATSPIRGNVNGVPTPSAAVLFGRMEPETVVGVKTRKLNADVVTHLVFRGDDSKDFTLPVLGRGVDPVPTEDGLAGVFFWRVNTLGRRGMPYLSRSLDKATMLDACVEHLAGKAEHANRFWMHATYEPEPGTDKASRAKNQKTEEELRAWLESPEPGAVAAEDLLRQLGHAAVEAALDIEQVLAQLHRDRPGFSPADRPVTLAALDGTHWRDDGSRPTCEDFGELARFACLAPVIDVDAAFLDLVTEIGPQLEQRIPSDPRKQ